MKSNSRPGKASWTRVEDEAPKPKRETGPKRWARWAEMVEGGMTKAEVARSEGVSRAAVTVGIGKIARASTR